MAKNQSPALFPVDHIPNTRLAQSAGAVEYTNCISAEGNNSSNECPGGPVGRSSINILTTSLLRGTIPPTRVQLTQSAIPSGSPFLSSRT